MATVLEHNECINLYYEEVKERYPHLSQEDFEEICRTPAIFIKRVLREGNLQDINIKYVGKLYVNERRLKDHINNLEKFYAAGNIDEEYYNKNITIARNKLYKIQLEKNEEELS